MRISVVAALSLIAHLGLVYGLLAVLPAWLAGPLVGVLLALVADEDARTVLPGALAGLGVGCWVAQPWFLGSALELPATLGLYIGLAVTTAMALTWVLGQRANPTQLRRWLALLVVAVLVGLLWVSTLRYNEGAFTPGEPTVNAWLNTPPALGQTPGDRDYFLSFFYQTQAGVPYYDAVIATYKADAMGEFRLPNGVPGYRLPTLFALWQLLPAQGSALVPAFLLFATLAVGSAYAIGAQLANGRAGLLSALLVAAAYLNISTSSYVVFVDGWAMAITLAGLALLVAAQQRATSGLLWAAMAVLLLAASMREILLYPILLGMASVALLPRAQWWHALRPWLVALALFALIYTTHILAIDGRVDKSGSVGFWLNGSLGHLLATLRFFDQLIGGAPWFVPLLVLSGLAGAARVMQTQRQLGALLVAAVLVPHLTFLLFGSAGRDLITGAVPGYWAMLVQPLALALAPVAWVQLGQPHKLDSCLRLCDKG
ncbi:MAG: hypothetical protein PHH58_08395 [Rhodoferax sp.]|nr:hypothetical protein [Rhodoferax sp.]